MYSENYIIIYFANYLWFINSCFAHSFNPGIKFRCLAKKVNAENLGRHLAQKLTGFSLSHFCGLFAFHPQFGTAHTDCSSPAKGRSLPASLGKENPEVSVQSLEFKPRWCTSLILFIYLLHSTGQDFTAAQRERAQEDFKVLFKGAPPHPPSHSHTKDSHSTGITLLFSNSAWVLLRPTELSTFKEL